jgi:hypothetical protein
MTIRSTIPYTYNGGWALVDDGATRYTQDLAAPLSQLLQTTQGSATTDELYAWIGLQLWQGLAERGMVPMRWAVCA